MRKMVNLPSCVDDPRQKSEEHKISMRKVFSRAAEQQSTKIENTEQQRMVNDFLWMVHERW